MQPLVYPTADLRSALDILHTRHTSPFAILSATRIVSYCALLPPQRRPRTHRIWAPLRHRIDLTPAEPNRAVIRGVVIPSLRAALPEASAQVLIDLADDHHLRVRAGPHDHPGTCISLHRAHPAEVDQWHSTHAPRPEPGDSEHEVLTHHDLPAAAFARHLATLRHACARADANRPLLECARIEPLANALRLTATDGHLVVQIDRPCPGAAPDTGSPPPLLPVQYFRPLARIAKRHPQAPVALRTHAKTPNGLPYAYRISIGPESLYLPAPANLDQYPAIDRVVPAPHQVRTRVALPNAGALLRYLPDMAHLPFYPVQLSTPATRLHVYNLQTEFASTGPQALGVYCANRLREDLALYADRPVELQFTDDHEPMLITCHHPDHLRRSLHTARRRL